MSVLRKNDPRAEYLANVQLFSGCSRDELHRIASTSTVVDVDAGRVLVREGEYRRDFFVIVDGHATVTIEGQHLATLGPGSFFGEMAMLNRSPRIATVTASEPMTILSFSALEFATLVASLPLPVARRMLAGMTARLGETDRRAVATEAGGTARSQPVGVGAGNSPGS